MIDYNFERLLKCIENKTIFENMETKTLFNVNTLLEVHRILNIIVDMGYIADYRLCTDWSLELVKNNS